MRPAGKGPLESLVLGHELGDVAAFRKAIATALDGLQ